MSTFTNRLGQTISPGDRVVVIARGYSHAIKERTGTFVGTSPSGSPQVRVKDSRRVWVNADGTPAKWYSNCHKDGVHTVAQEYESVRTYGAKRVYKIA